MPIRIGIPRVGLFCFDTSGLWVSRPPVIFSQLTAPHMLPLHSATRTLAIPSATLQSPVGSSANAGANPTARNNPDVSKQNRPTLGMPILIGMKKKPGVDQWEGQVYNAKDGQLYSSTIKPVDPDHMEIQGCVLGFLCGGETWTRVAGPIPSSPANSMAK